jgi:single-stranded DNA-binding protein
VTVWGDLAAPRARQLSKGDFVTVVGRIETRYDATNSIGYLDLIAEDVAKTMPGSASGGNQNAVTIAGRLGRDAEYRLVAKKQNVPMLTFSIANSRESAGGFERTSWLNVVVWGELATTCRSLKGNTSRLRATSKLPSGEQATNAVRSIRLSGRN